MVSFSFQREQKMLKNVKNFEKKIKYGNFMEGKIPKFETGIL